MKTYELIENEYGSCVKMIEDSIISFIPIEINNIDYQNYLMYLEEQNG